MKSPYFRITAMCRNDSCTYVNGVFTKDRKSKLTRSTDGTDKQITNLVCPPACRYWGKIDSIEEVTA